MVASLTRRRVRALGWVRAAATPRLSCGGAGKAAAAGPQALARDANARALAGRRAGDESPWRRGGMGSCVGGDRARGHGARSAAARALGAGDARRAGGGGP